MGLRYFGMARCYLASHDIRAEAIGLGSIAGAIARYTFIYDILVFIVIVCVSFVIEPRQVLNGLIFRMHITTK